MVKSSIGIDVSDISPLPLIVEFVDGKLCLFCCSDSKDSVFFVELAASSL